MSLDERVPTDEVVRVRSIRLPRVVPCYWLTPEGEAALDAALLTAADEPAESEPTVAIPRAVAQEAEGCLTE